MVRLAAIHDNNPLAVPQAFHRVFVATVHEAPHSALVAITIQQTLCTKADSIMSCTLASMARRS